MLFYSREQYDKIFDFLEENYGLSRERSRLIMKLNDWTLQPFVDRNARIQAVLDGTYTHQDFLNDCVYWNPLKKEIV